MKLKEIKIENFRSIKNSSIRFHELTAIVGENNSGKTAILRALNSVFNFDYEKKDFINGVHRYAPRTITKITITLSETPPKEEYQEMVDDNGDMHIRFTYNYSKSASGRRLYCDKNGMSKQIEESFMDVVKRDIDFVYIPATRSTKDFEWGENSIFERLITKYLEDHTRNRDNLSQRASSAGNSILDQVLQRLATELTALNMYEDVGKYQIRFRDAIDYRIFLDKLGLEILNTQETGSLPVSEYGSGIKSLTVIALHRMLANLNQVSIVLGIEEPETNLHPQAQRMLINSLKNSRQSCETQAVFATHSTVIVDALDHDDIVLVRKVKDDNRGFRSESKQLADSFWEDHDIQELKHYNFFRYRNSDFFFSRFVILTESITDSQVIEQILQRDSGRKLFYVSIVNLDGVKNIRYPFFLLKDLGIPFCAVVDKDFFTPYKNGKLDESRNNETGLPEYSSKASNNKVIQYVFDTTEKREALEYSLGKSYTQFFDFAKAYGLLSMQYCLEMDLVTSDKCREVLYDHFGLQGEGRKQKALLIDRKQAIKEPTLILPIVRNLVPKDYPVSLKRIRKVLTEQIKDL
jgi:predicted ATPase